MLIFNGNVAIEKRKREGFKMKKKILFCLAILGAASMLSGFDSAETADSILEKMQTASSSAEGATMDMDFNMNVGINIGDDTTTSTLNIAASGGFDIAMNMDPVAMSMDGSMSLSAMGTNEDVTMKLYGVTTDDGQFDTYVYTEDSASGESGWEHESAVIGNMAELMAESSQVDMSEYGLNFELAPEAADADGTECYLLTAVMDSASFQTMLEKSAELTGEDLSSDDDVAMVLSMLDGVKINLEYYVDAATYLPVKFHMDLNDSDLSAINQYAAMAMGEMEEGTSVTIDLNDVSFDATMAYGAANDITVPEEALAAAEADESGSAEDTTAAGELSSVENAVEGAVEDLAIAETEVVTEVETEIVSAE